MNLVSREKTGKDRETNTEKSKKRKRNTTSDECVCDQNRHCRKTQKNAQILQTPTKGSRTPIQRERQRDYTPLQSYTERLLTLLLCYIVSVSSQ